MLIVKHRLSDGTVVLVDGVDGARFTIRADQWATIAVLPVAQRRPAVEAIVLQDRADAARQEQER